MVLCRMVDLSILQGSPWTCSMVHSSLMSTLNWSRRFFSDLFREALSPHTTERNDRSGGAHGEVETQREVEHRVRWSTR